ncbi:MAG: glycoside hydrolase family 3 C-terminal domain-containing protein [Humibacter sp.]
MDASKTAAQRADALLAASTQQQEYRWLDEQAANSPTTTKFGSVTYPVQVDCTPTVVYTDGPDGVRSTTGVTAFPGPLAMGATWDTALNEQRGAVMGDEAFNKRKNGILGPGASGSRTPLAGRTQEYFGEDPLLSGDMLASATDGIQSVPGEMADFKHYVANEQENSRQTSSSNVDERTLREVYDLPYEIGIAKSDPSSVMCSYNQINGVYSCENPLLTTDLKGYQGFAGYVMSDFGAVHSTAASLNAGLDQELNAPKYYTPTLLDAALASGQITQARIDDAAKRVITAYIKQGLFDHPMPATAVANASTPAHKALALQAAEESAVLLRNEGALPLSTNASTKIAVIGVTSNTQAKGVCSQGSSATSGTLSCENVVSALQGITARAAQSGATVTYYPGTDLASAAALAASSDVAIVFGYQKMGEFADVTDLHLQGGGDALIDAVASANKHTIAVLNTGSAVEMPWLGKTQAVIDAWYSGEQQGPALAALLWGDVDFSGKLPMTFPKSLADTPTGTNVAQYPGVKSGSITQVDYSEGLQVGYRWYDAQNIAPLFEFGYGLSYTKFAYSDLSVQTKVTDGKPVSTVSFTVKNAGSVAGAEVPQVYLTLPTAAKEPGKRLVGFDRVQLGAGESKRVSVVVDSSDANQPFSIWDADAHTWSVLDGDYTVSVGSSSRDLPLTEGVIVDRVAPKIASVTLDQSQKIVVTATDELSGVARIEYSTQKNKQDASAWATYTGPLQVDAKSTVSFRAVDNAGNVSDVVEVNRKDLK